MRTATLTCLFTLGLSMVLTGAEAAKREAITFLLGDAREGMYALAKTFHDAQGDRVVTTAHSLQAVRDYLEQHPPKNAQPWGRVELVLHGNGCGQTDVPLLEGGAITTTAYLSEMLDRGEFRPLPDHLMDAGSEIRLHGCALGQDETFLRLVSRAFGGLDELRPTVFASRLYTCYQPTPEGARRYFSQAWSLVFPQGHEPSTDQIVARFKVLHPGCNLDARDALSRQSARFPGDSYLETKPLHFQWKVVFERAEERPTASAALAWLHRQKELVDQLKVQGLTLEDLTWVTKGNRESFHGHMYPTLQVEGAGKAFHLLRTQRETDLPWEDPRYCASAR